MSDEELNALMDETSDLIEKVYEYSAVGSNCHIVIDDGNVEDAAIQSCLQLLEENIHEVTPEQLVNERKILTNLLRMPVFYRECIC